MTAVFGSKIFKSSLKKAQTKNKVTCKDFVWTQGPCSGTTCSIYLTSPCSNNKRQVVGKIFMYFDIPFNDPTPESVHLDDFGFEKI